MISRERVVNTLRHQPTDKLPVDYVFEDYETITKIAGHYGVSNDELTEYLGCDIAYINVMDEIQKFILDPELMDFSIKNGFARRDEENDYIAYDRWGIGWHMKSDGERPCTHDVIKETEDIETYQAPDPLVPGQFYDIDRKIGGLNKKNLAVCIAQYYGLFEKSWLLRGYEGFFIGCYEDEKMTEKLLDKILEYRVKLTNEIVKYDIAFGHSGDDYGTQNGPAMSLEMWRKFFKPRLAKIWSIYKKHDLPVIHHSCGDCTMFLDDMLEIGLDAINPLQPTCMDIEALGKRYGNNLVFYGGIDCQEVLTYGTPEQVRENVKNAVACLGKHHGLILAPFNVMKNVPMDNFEALVESVNQYREY